MPGIAPLHNIFLEEVSGKNIKKLKAGNSDWGAITLSKETKIQPMQDYQTRLSARDGKMLVMGKVSAPVS